MLASARGHLKVDMSPQLVKATGPALQHVAAHVLSACPPTHVSAASTVTAQQTPYPDRVISSRSRVRAFARRRDTLI